MNESNEIHRDIYVGMVAEEMAQSGYYGEDVTLYGFLANGELHSFDDEQECAETYLLALAAGAQRRAANNPEKMVRSRCAWPRFADSADASRKREASLPAARRFRNAARADHGRGVSRNARCALRVATLI